MRFVLHQIRKAGGAAAGPPQVKKRPGPGPAGRKDTDEIMDKNQEAEIKLICGLGNPGPNYERTRHNCGFMLADCLAGRYGGRWQRTKFKAEVCRAVIGGERVLIMKPLTFMNNSGEAVRALLDYYRLRPAQLLVAYDDVDVPLGSLRIREQGSPGTHNGMRSLVQHLGSRDFPRLRIGIGPQPRETDIVDYVLGAYGGAEQELLEKTIEKAADAVELALAKNLQTAMSRFNERSRRPKPAPRREQTDEAAGNAAEAAANAADKAGESAGASEKAETACENE